MNEISLFRVIVIFIVPFLVVLIPIFIGRQYGIFLSHKSDAIQKAPVGAVVGSSFSLLAFLTAFTFSIAFSHQTIRKKLMTDEVTNIRTTYLRAGLLPEPSRSNARKLLAEYVDLRIEIAGNMGSLDKNINRSQQILNELWAIVESFSPQERGQSVNSLFTTSVINLSDIFAQRIYAARDLRIPQFTVWILLFVSFLTMLSLGFQFGVTDKGSAWITIFLAIIFALVMCLIVALDRPELGIGKMDPKPMIYLQQEMKLP